MFHRENPEGRAVALEGNVFGTGGEGLRRYTSREFPAYRHRPGVTPHPVRHPEGHSFCRVSLPAAPFDPRRWRSRCEYLYGVDLYNDRFYWEAHEAWEELWKTTARRDPPGRFLQGLIQLSAALIKREEGTVGGMRSLAGSGVAKLRGLSRGHPVYCGLSLREYLARMEGLLSPEPEVNRGVDPAIRLAFGDG